jgi:hypothetical protein
VDGRRGGGKFGWRRQHAARVGRVAAPRVRSSPDGNALGPRFPDVRRRTPGEFGSWLDAAGDPYPTETVVNASNLVDWHRARTTRDLATLNEDDIVEFLLDWCPARTTISAERPVPSSPRPLARRQSGTAVGWPTATEPPRACANCRPIPACRPQTRTLAGMTASPGSRATGRLIPRRVPAWLPQLRHRRRPGSPARSLRAARRNGRYCGQARESGPAAR